MQMLIPQALFLALSLIASGTPAIADTAVSAPPLHVAQVYTDLPGVKTPEEAEEAKTVVCEQTVVHHDNNPTYGEEYETINNCRKGNGPVFQSRNSPRSNERQLRGFNY
jgi:hypothetical protein